LVNFGFHQSRVISAARAKVRYIDEEAVPGGSYSGLSGPATAARFHGPGPKGQNAGVVVPADAAKSPFGASATLTDAQAADLAKGNWYFNVRCGEQGRRDSRPSQPGEIVSPAK
jgi:hypothetical protein